MTDTVIGSVVKTLKVKPPWATSLWFSGRWMDMDHNKTSKWEIQVFTHTVQLEQGPRRDSLSTEIEKVSGRRCECWVVFQRVQRSSLFFWKWKGSEKVRAIWSGHTQACWSSDPHHTFSSQYPACKLCPEVCVLNLQEISFYFFMKELANQSSLIKQCLVISPLLLIGGFQLEPLK